MMFPRDDDDDSSDNYMSNNNMGGYEPLQNTTGMSKAELRKVGESA